MNKRELLFNTSTKPGRGRRTLQTALFASAMLLVSSTLFAQVKVGTNPTVIDANNNLEVESATVGNKVFIKKSGKLTIADGTQGAAKILTSDTNGEASWEPKSAQDAEVMLTVTAGTQTVSTGGQTMNFNGTLFDKSSNFDLATDIFTAPSAGYYNVNLSVECNTLNPSASGRFGSIHVNNVVYRIIYNEVVPANAGYSATGAALLKLDANDTVKIVLGKAGTPNYVVSKGSVDIYKISN